MGRCLSLFGMMFFILGVVALASLAKGSPRPSPLAEEAPTPTLGWARLPRIAATSFHAPYSLN